MVEALISYGLLDRARISTMELPTLKALAELEPGTAPGLDRAPSDPGLDERRSG